MRNLVYRFLRRVLAPFQPADTYQADFVDVAEMVLVARALRLEGYGARLDDHPLRLIVSVPKRRRRLPEEVR